MLFFVWSILIAKDLYFVKEYSLGLRWNNLDTVLSVTRLSISVEYYGNHKYIAGYLPMITWTTMVLFFLDFVSVINFLLVSFTNELIK